ncbi:MAG: RNA polymerase sigma factor [Chitinophagales bacterium]
MSQQLTQQIPYEKIILQSDQKLYNGILRMGIDAELVRKAGAGDRNAQYALYRESYSLLMSVCRRYTKQDEDARALLNTGFLKILTHADKRKEHIPPEVWMRRVMINTAIDAFRRQKNYNELTALQDFSDHTSEHFTATADDPYGGRIGADALQHMMDALPEMSAKVFNLFAVDGYSHAEIAEMLGIQTGTSKWHVNNARTLLQKMIRMAEQKV